MSSKLDYLKKYVGSAEKNDDFQKPKKKSNKKKKKKKKMMTTTEVNNNLDVHVDSENGERIAKLNQTVKIIDEDESSFPSITNSKKKKSNLFDKYQVYDDDDDHEEDIEEETGEFAPIIVNAHELLREERRKEIRKGWKLISKGEEDDEFCDTKAHQSKMIDEISDKKQKNNSEKNEDIQDTIIPEKQKSKRKRDKKQLNKSLSDINDHNIEDDHSDTLGGDNNNNDDDDDNDYQSRKQKRRIESENVNRKNVSDIDKEEKASSINVMTGLKTAKQLDDVLDRKRKEEKEDFEKMDASLTGVGASVVYRDPKTGKKVEDYETYKQLKEKEMRKRRRKKDRNQKEGEEEEEEEEEYIKQTQDQMEWGKGLVQQQAIKTAEQLLLEERDKPFARTADDPELDQLYRDQLRDGDPMAALLAKQKSKKKSAQGPSTQKPAQYQGYFPPNRFGIRPGRHWDGVDRSNGFEEKYFLSINERKAKEADYYKYSVADM